MGLIRLGLEISAGFESFVTMGYSRSRRLTLFAAPVASLAASSINVTGVRVAAFLAFAPQNGMRRQLKMLFNDPFNTVHHYWNWLAAALLFPYFVVMIVLALYGIHRYALCYHFYKYRRRHKPDPPQ